MRRISRRLALTFASAALCVVVCACSGQLPGFGPAGPTATPTPTPEPTPALGALATSYLKFAATLDAARCKYERVVGDPSSSTAALRLVAGETANANRFMTNHVAALRWPSPVQGDVQNLVKAIAAVEAELRLAAEQSTRPGVVHHLDNVRQLGSTVSTRTDLVHKDLHIASPVLVCP